MPLFPSKFHRDLILTQLRTLGVSQVAVEFSGSGDSGNIEGVFCQDANGKFIPLPDATFSWPRTHSMLTNGDWVRHTKEQDCTLQEILENLTTDALDEQGLDWYNNEGGQGRLTIDFTQSPPKIDLHCELNVTTTEDYDVDYTQDQE